MKCNLLSAVSNIITINKDSNPIQQVTDLDPKDYQNFKAESWKIPAESIINLLKGKMDIDNSLLPKGKKYKLNNAINLYHSDLTPEFSKAIENKNYTKPYLLALNELISSQKSEYDKSNSVTNLSDDDKKSIMSIKDDQMQVNLSRSAEVIGRQFFISNGKVLATKVVISEDPITKKPIYSTVDSVTISNMHYKVGMSILKSMEQDGFVNIEEEGTVINDVIDRTENLTNSSRDWSKPTRKAITATLNLDKITFNEISDKEIKALKTGKTNYTTIHKLVTGIRALSQVILPVHETKPTHTVMNRKELKKRDAFYTTDSTDKAREYVHESEVVINKYFMDVLKHIKSIYDESNDETEFMRLLNEKGFDYETLVHMFGIQGMEGKHEDREVSIIGQNLSKKTPLFELVANLDLFYDEQGNLKSVHNIYNITKNSRLGMLNSVGNSQSSVFIRHLFTSKGETLNLTNKLEMAKIAEDLASSIKNFKIKNAKGKLIELTKDDVSEFIANPSGDNKLTKLVDMFDKLFKSDTINIEQQKAFLTNVQNEGRAKSSEVVEVLSALSDIREATNEGRTEVITQYSTKPDGTASGVTFQFLQSMGYAKTSDDKLLKTLGRLGMITGNSINTDETLKDVYNITSNFVKSLIATSKEEEDIDEDSIIPSALTEDNKKKAENLKQALIQVFHDNIRDMVKDPTMVINYNQKRAGALSTMADSIVDKILDNIDESMPYIRSLGIYEETTTDTNIKKDTELKTKIKNKLIKDKNSVVNTLFDTVTKEVSPMVSKRIDLLTKLFNKLQTLQEGKLLKILPAMAVLDSIGTKDTRKHGMPLTKTMNILRKTDDGNVVNTMEEVNNLNTLVVSVIHSMDWATMAIAINNAMQVYYETYGERYKGALIPVHDELVASPKFNTIFEKEYTKAMAEVVYKYSPEEQLANQIELIGNLDEEGKNLIREAREATETKKSNMDTYKINVKPGVLFGSNDSEVEVNVENKTTDVDGNVLTELSKKSKTVKAFIDLGKTIFNTNKEDRYDDKTQKVYIDFKGNNGNLEERVEHEITHYFTTEYLVKHYNDVFNTEVNNEEVNRIRSLYATIDKLSNRKNELDKKSNLFKLLDNWSGNKENNYRMLAEFLSEFNSSKTFKEDVKSISDTKELKPLIRLVEYITKSVKHFIASLEGKQVDLVIDYNSVSDVIDDIINTSIEGKTGRITSSKKRYKGYTEDLENAFDDTTLFYDKYEPYTVERLATKVSTNINDTMKKLVTDKAIKLTSKGIDKIDSVLYRKMPKYAKAKDYVVDIYNSNEHIQQLMHTMKVDNFSKAGRLVKNKVLRMITNIKEEATKRESMIVSEYNKLTRTYSKKDKEAVYELIQGLPLHRVFLSPVELSTKEDIDNRILELEHKLGKRVNKEVVDTVAYLKDGKLRANTIYSIEKTYGYTKEAKEVEELVALKAITGNGHLDAFIKLNKHKELLNFIKDNVLARNTLLSDIDNNAPIHKNQDVLDGNFRFKTVSIDDIDHYSYDENHGWKILKTPTKDTFGIVYREVIDEEFTDNAGVTEDYRNEGIPYQAQDDFTDNILNNRILLTKEQKEKVGIVKDAGTLLANSVNHLYKIKETRAIRSILVADGIRYKLDGTNEGYNKVIDMITNETLDHPWFLANTDDKALRYEDLPKEIKAKYKPIKTRLSKDGKFNEKVWLVRKDMEHWLVGQHAHSFFSNSKLQMTSKWLKNFISMWKIGAVITNPKKLMLDTVSNNIQLGIMGVPLSFSTKVQADVVKDYNKFIEIRNLITKYEMLKLSYPDNKDIYNSKIRVLQNRLKGNLVAEGSDLGFINSLSSDIVNQSNHTVKGLSRDIKEVLDWFTKDKKGNPNKLSKILEVASIAGYDGPAILNKFGKKLLELKLSPKEMDNYIVKLSNNLKDIKDSKDATAKLEQLLLTPSNELVKLGTTVNDITDLTFRMALYKHLIRNGVSKDEAEITAIEATADYKEELPLLWKTLSRYNIVKFPAFNLRSLRPILLMLRRRGVSSIGEMSLHEELNLGQYESVLDSMARKVEHPMSLLDSPLEAVGIDSLIPVHMW